MDIVTFVKQFPVKSFSKGQVLLSEGDITDSLLAIRSGFVKVLTHDTNGSERILWIAGRYDIAPSEQLFAIRRPLQFSYIALSDGQAYLINKTSFLKTANADAVLMGEIARSMSGHYDDLLSRISSAEQTSVRQKLIATLLYLASRFSAESSVDLYRLGLHLTHEDIATLIGSTRETVSLELQKLRQNGIIAYDRQSFVINVSAGTAALE